VGDEAPGLDVAALLEQPGAAADVGEQDGERLRLAHGSPDDRQSAAARHGRPRVLAAVSPPPPAVPRRRRCPPRTVAPAVPRPPAACRYPPPPRAPAACRPAPPRPGP